jgi:RNA-binding protein
LSFNPKVFPDPFMNLSSTQKRHLRGLAHHINPVVTVGDKGLTENVMAELETALDHHELIKVKLRADREARGRLTREIAENCSALLVQQIGQVSCFFRRNTQKPSIELPDK